MLGVTTTIFHDRRTKKKDETFPVKLRLTYQREQKYYPLGVSLTIDDWEKVNQDNPRKQNKDHKLFFAKIENKANETIKELDPFSFEAFEKKFMTNKTNKKEVFVLMEQYVKKLKDEQRFTTAENYNVSLNCFKSFIQEKKKKKLFFRDITPEWLFSFEKWKTEDGASTSTVGVYLRNLRAIYNLAVHEGIISKDNYPFGKRKYEIPSSNNIKKALKLEDVKKIYNYKPSKKEEEKAIDIWLFSYLANGINMKDIALLQYKNIDKTKISFIRAKTKRSSKSNNKYIIVPLLPELKIILEKWGQKKLSPDTFVFNFIDNSDSPESKVKKIKQATKTTNSYLKNIGVSLKLDIKLTTYVARHTYATVLKRSGAPLELISENLGHKDLETTENYLDSFEDDVKRSFQENLLKFN